MNILLIQGERDGCLLYYYHDGQNKFEVKTKYFQCSSTYLMRKICLNYETDFDGNRKAIIKNHNFIQKTPILVLRNHSLFFPTCSFESNDCCWINYYCLSDNYFVDQDQIKIELLSRCHVFERLFGQLKSEEKISQGNHLNYHVSIRCSQRVLKKQLCRCKEIDQFTRANIYSMNL